MLSIQTMAADVTGLHLCWTTG